MRPPDSSRPTVPGNGDGARPSDLRALQKCRAFGHSAALCFEADVTRNGDPTVRLEAASATGDRKYSWDQKISVQLTVKELAVVTAVFFGWLPSCEYKNHGEKRDKSFVVENQGDHLFVRLSAGGAGTRAVPVDSDTAFAVAMLLFARLQKNYPQADGSVTLNILRFTVARLRSTPPVAKIAGNHERATK